jgi:hypothetical protein
VNLVFPFKRDGNKEGETHNNDKDRIVARRPRIARGRGTRRLIRSFDLAHQNYFRDVSFDLDTLSSINSPSVSHIPIKSMAIKSQQRIVRSISRSGKICPS